MSRINDFLTEAEVFYLATCDGTQPKIRPIGAHIEMDGKVLIGIGQHKEVYKQMQANPLVEIAAYKPNGHWLRYTGRAVFETDPKYADTMIAAMHLQELYNEQNGNKLAVFHLEDATALDITVMGPGVDLLAE